MADGDSNGAQPCVIVIGVVRNKEGIHLKLVIVDEIEGGVYETLKAVAEQRSSRQPDGKVGVRTNPSLSSVVYKEK